MRQRPIFSLTEAAAAIALLAASLTSPAGRAAGQPLPAPSPPPALVASPDAPRLTFAPDTLAVRSLHTAFVHTNLAAVNQALKAGADPNATVTFDYGKQTDIRILGEMVDAQPDAHKPQAIAIFRALPISKIFCGNLYPKRKAQIL